MLSLNVSNHLAANSSSIIRRSQDNVTVITLCTLSSAVKTRRVPPTAMIQAWGGLITAENSAIPNIPRLEMVNEPPWNSCSCKLPSLARLARSYCKEKIQLSSCVELINSISLIFRLSVSRLDILKRRLYFTEHFWGLSTILWTYSAEHIPFLSKTCVSGNMHIFYGNRSSRKARQVGVKLLAQRQTNASIKFRNKYVGTLAENHNFKIYSVNKNTQTWSGSFKHVVSRARSLSVSKHCAPSPPLPQQQSTDNDLRLTLG